MKNQRKIRIWPPAALALPALIAAFIIGCPKDPEPKKPAPPQQEVQLYKVTVGTLTNANGSRVDVDPPAATGAGVEEGTEITLLVTERNNMELVGGSLRVTAENSGAVALTLTSRGGRFDMPPENVMVRAVFKERTGTSPKEGLDKWDDELWPLIDEMSLEEKAGQMLQPDKRGLIVSGGVHSIVTYKLGSLLNGGGGNPDNVEDGGIGRNPNTPAGWVTMIDTFMGYSMDDTDKITLPATGKGIPLIYGIDAVHGHTTVPNATAFPHNIGLGAIAVGDLEKGKTAAYDAAKYTAIEMRSAGVHWTFAPCVGYAENMRWGRVYETYSQNIDIVTEMGVQAVLGYQENGVAATAKHFISEGQTTGGGTRGGVAVVSDEDIAKALKSFEAAIEAGVMAIMPTYSDIQRTGETSGSAVHGRRDLIQDVLKDHLDFKGVIITDWNGYDLVSGSSTTAKVRNGINAGLDMFMLASTDPNGSIIRDVYNAIIANVRNGDIHESFINNSVLRILRLKKALGVLDADPRTVTAKTEDFGNQEHRARAREIARQSLVLMKNESNALGALASATNIALVGDFANNVGAQCGGWTVAWVGNMGNTFTEGVNIKDALIGRNVNSGSDKIPGKTFTYNALGSGSLSGSYDAVIAVVGENPYAEHNGVYTNDNPIPLRAGTAATANNYNSSGSWGFNDVAMLRRVYDYKNNTPAVPVIVIIFSGRPIGDVSSAAGEGYTGSHLDNWDALIAAWLPGTQGGDAVADILFGADPTTGQPYDFVAATPFEWRTHPDIRNQGGSLISGFSFGHGLKKNGSLINP